MPGIDVTGDAPYAAKPLIFNVLGLEESEDNESTRETLAAWYGKERMWATLKRMKVPHSWGDNGTHAPAYTHLKFCPLITGNASLIFYYGLLTRLGQQEAADRLRTIGRASHLCYLLTA
jgi:hypothetical protein